MSPFNKFIPFDIKNFTCRFYYFSRREIDAIAIDISHIKTSFIFQWQQFLSRSIVSSGDRIHFIFNKVKVLVFGKDKATPVAASIDKIILIRPTKSNCSTSTSNSTTDASSQIAARSIDSSTSYFDCSSSTIAATANASSQIAARSIDSSTSYFDCSTSTIAAAANARTVRAARSIDSSTSYFDCSTSTTSAAANARTVKAARSIDSSTTYFDCSTSTIAAAANARTVRAARSIDNAAFNHQGTAAAYTCGENNALCIKRSLPLYGEFIAFRKFDALICI